MIASENTANNSMSRRTFGKLAALGLVASAVPHHASSKLDVGIGTYSYHNLTLDDMIARTKLDRAGIRCVSYYSATIKDGQDLENALRFAKILGSQNVSGDATGNILTRIDQGCSQEGLTFGIHNHFFKGEKFAYESPEDVLGALAGLSNMVGATADVGHFASCGYDTVDAIRKLGPRLKLVHLKDVAASGGEVNVLLGKGISRIPEVMRELRRQNFAHLIAIEYEKEGDVSRDMKADVEFARKFA
jgi:sugar phosphate isomerase/epimerase